MPQKILDRAELIYFYKTCGLSDRQIAEKFGVVKTAVAHAREKHRIHTRPALWRKGEQIASEKLRALGFTVENKHVLDPKTPYSLLVNHKVRIGVKSASESDDHRFYYTLTIPPAPTIKASYYQQLENGRLRKDWSRVSDLLIFVAFPSNKASNPYFFILPPDRIPESQRGLSIDPKNHKNAYCRYLNRFDLVQDRLK